MIRPTAIPKATPSSIPSKNRKINLRFNVCADTSMFSPENPLEGSAVFYVIVSRLNTYVSHS